MSKRRHDPELTQSLILGAAKAVFADKGFDGARVDQIAALAQVNKQLIYYYFDNKDTLFSKVLEAAYQDIRTKEAALDLDALSARDAVLKLVEFTWHYYLENPEFIRLLNSENQLQARHLKALDTIVPINRSWLSITETILLRGQEDGSIRPGIDAMQLNISISALGFFYLINQSTLSILYQKDLKQVAELEQRLAVMKDTISCWLTPHR
ncbi:TetR/AcrR family transcriptional regulator [Mangrovibacter yixingensis]|uniref:TetR/AcrR family transcriptional regulator n=1 Tax=Mangrovibacter yixingensis TaxID=1529639 RepID=UPI001CFF3F7B|nr:TetR/AcrR family transcriptional regulator [Mangrovibacter yixingensis]